MRVGLRFFVDRGVGSRIVPEGLRAAGWTVVTMDERYGILESQNVDDPVWIRDGSSREEILITKDRNVAKRPFEAEAIADSAARVLVIASSNITGRQALEHLVANASAIERAADDPRPWVLGVYESRLGPIRLNVIGSRHRSAP